MSISSPQSSLDRTASKRHPHLPRLSSLSSVSDGTAEKKSPGHHRQPSDCNESTGLVQRCVIVQRDQNGFGFTVSGDRIVLVQSVRPGGAAMRAGVQEGDRIVKVNGTLVANSSHIEVVKLIKSGAYVALTLLGSPSPSMGMSGLQQDLSSSVSPRNTIMSPAPPPPPPPLPPSQRITGPKPLQDPEVQKHATQILWRMLKQEEAELQTLSDVYNRSPNQSLQEQIEGARRRVIQLQLKIRQETAGSGDMRLYNDRSSVGFKVVEGRLSVDSQDGDSGLESGTERFPSTSENSMNRNSILSDPGVDSSHTSPVISSKIFHHHRRQGSDVAFIAGHDLIVDNSRAAIIGPEEDYDHGFYMTEVIKSKRTMGLGSLYGENDLHDLDIDPHKERLVAAKQIAQLEEILSKFEEERSLPMAFALNTYMTYAGIRTRETRPASTSDKSQSFPDKDKRLPFFPKTKKSSSAKKDKDREEDKKRNPILKYIGKPKSSSQSTFHVPLSPGEVKPGNVRNIIQHFENNQQYELEFGTQRLSTGSFPEDLLDYDSSRSEIKLGRSESLKGREELKKSRKADNVPRSRSDVDMDAAAEAARLHQSASSSASSLSTRSLDNPTPPFTPKLCRRSIESPNLMIGGDSLLSNLQEDDLGHLSDLDPEPDSQNWQHTVGREVAQNLSPRERARQEVIHELFVTETSHLRVLRVLDLIFYQRMRKENLLSQDELWLVFPNLPELIEIHNSLTESMKRMRDEGPIVKEIGDLMLSRFDGEAGEEVCQQTAKFCSYQTSALELIKTKKRKEARFSLFMQEAESSPQCRRLQLKDLIVSEMQRLTKYPLLLENIIKHTDAGTQEHEKLCHCRDRCKDILKYVNESVKQADNEHRLMEYQKRLDTTSLERSNNAQAAEFKNLDLTTKRMIHEGSLTWRITKDKTIDLHVLLLEDLLVLLQKQDEKLVLKCHSKTTMVSTDTKQTFSPVIKLNSVLVRSVATDKRAIFIICTSQLGPQIYELVALTSSEKNMWKELIEEAAKSAMRKPSSSIKRNAQEQAKTRSPSASAVLQSAGIPPLLPTEGGLRTNSDDLQSGDENHGDLISNSNPEVLDHPEVEGEEDEAQTPTQQLLASKVEDAGGGSKETDSSIYYPCQQWPSATEGLAESALEDVENLRHLILRSLLPCRHSVSAPVAEPEDDLTPTPSVTGGVGHPWETTADTALETLDEEHLFDQKKNLISRPISSLENSRTVVDLTSSDRSSFRSGEETAWSVVESHSPRSPPDLLETQISQPEEGRYKVVRKAEVVGNNDDIPLPDSSQSERVLQEAGGIVDGNFFYVAMPAPPAVTPSVQEHKEADEKRGHSVRTESPSFSESSEMCNMPIFQPGSASPPNRSAEIESIPSDFLPSSLVIQDVDLIFRTIEQLTAKLHKLKEVESAHQALVKSLGKGVTEDCYQQVESRMEEDKGTDPYHKSTLISNSFFVKNSVSISLHRDSLTESCDDAVQYAMGL
ncbi:rho guanine nucleotide exchange factor 11 [Bombina bombina]|uniref:rho guanine nucleotide exchange factor 11 n=1 Tax=Bombina bombina TaxID=8345 RepID=UPI00235ABD22|nr:rho guanine nucleotide exchange factor 11 [Bombina bombina]